MAVKPVVSAADTLLARVLQMKDELRDKTQQVNAEQDDDTKADLRSECRALERKIDKVQDELVLLRRTEWSRHHRTRSHTHYATQHITTTPDHSDLPLFRPNATLAVDDNMTTVWEELAGKHCEGK